jgi:hypothetical protein
MLERVVGQSLAFVLVLALADNLDGDERVIENIRASAGLNGLHERLNRALKVARKTIARGVQPGASDSFSLVSHELRPC